MLLEWCLEAQNKHMAECQQQTMKKKINRPESEPLNISLLYKIKKQSQKNWLTHFSVGSRVHSILFTTLIRNVLSSGVPGVI